MRTIMAYSTSHSWEWGCRFSSSTYCLIVHSFSWENEVTVSRNRTFVMSRSWNRELYESTP